MTTLAHDVLSKVLFVLPYLLLAGCRASDLGTTHIALQARSVDASWLRAARSCWPELHATNGTLTHNLVDPEHLRTVFSAYANLPDGDLREIVAHPVLDAPEPDRSVLPPAETPILTRQQAIGNADPRSARRLENGSPAIPGDALCSIQSGTPIGFK